MVISDSPSVMLTAEGWRRLHDDLESLRQRRTDALAAASRPDADWTPPVDRQASPSEIEYLDHCISELEFVLSRAEPVSSDEREPGVVGVGSSVDVIWDDGSRETYTIVGPPEVSPRHGRISYASPVGLALIGRRAGDEVTVVTGANTSRIQIDAVS